MVQWQSVHLAMAEALGSFPGPCLWKVRVGAWLYMGGILHSWPEPESTRHSFHKLQFRSKV